MPCYKKGGCGPYESRPCIECPASRADYLDKDEHPENRRVPVKKTRFEPDSRHLSDYAFRTMAPLRPNELTIGNMRRWLASHEISCNCFALSIPKTCENPAGKYKNYADACTALMETDSPVHDTAELAAKRILDDVTESLNLVGYKPTIRFPAIGAPTFRLTDIPEVDPVMSPNNKLIQRYNLVRSFDIACQAAWYVAMYGLTSIETINPNPDYSDHDRLVKLQTQVSSAIRAIAKEYEAGSDNNEDLIDYLVRANIPVTDAVLMLYPIPDINARDMIWTSDKTDTVQDEN